MYLSIGSLDCHCKREDNEQKKQSHSPKLGCKMTRRDGVLLDGARPPVDCWDIAVRIERSKWSVLHCNSMFRDVLAHHNQREKRLKKEAGKSSYTVRILRNSLDLRVVQRRNGQMHAKLWRYVEAG